MSIEVIDIGPQAGPQEQFVASDADITFYGGQAGAGKTAGLLLCAMQHIDNPRYGAVVFRRTEKQIRMEGAIWDESMNFFGLPGIDGTARTSKLEWDFPSGAGIGFRGCEHEKNVTDWQGAQIPFIGFDEVTHFTKNIFFYLITRNRSTCGVMSHVRATCNPIPVDDEVGGWVHKFLQWWIDPESGLAIEERSNVKRWFITRNDEWLWCDSKEECFEKYRVKELPLDHKKQIKPKSVTFIAAKLSDNPMMEEKDPEYRSNLEMQPEHIRQQLLEGNWNARPRAGTFFKVGMIKPAEAVPADLRLARGWDLAYTDGAGDWTVGIKLGEKDGVFYILDMARGQWETSYRDSVILQKAELDNESQYCPIRVPSDPAAGKAEGERLVRLLRPHTVTAVPVSGRGDKQVRAAGLSAQINAGNFRIVKAPWADGLLQRLDQFPTNGVPDDDVDSLAETFAELCKPRITAVVADSPRKKTATDEQSRFNALVPHSMRDYWEQLIANEPLAAEWKSVSTFLADVGKRPSEEHLVRPINENELLGPGNWFWGLPGDPIPELKPKRRIAAVGG